jgi:hypothetical protein
MYKYRAELASTFVNQNDNAFTQDALEDMVARSGPVPVTLNFEGDPIGALKKLEMVDGKVVCEVDLLQTVSVLGLPLFAVPAGAVKMEDIENLDGVQVIKKMRLTSIGITRQPADATLTKIEEIKDHGQA